MVDYKKSLVVSFNYVLGKKKKLLAGIFIYFVVKQSTRYKLMFFFLLTSILLGSLPSVLLKKKNRMHFLGYFYYGGACMLYNFILVYLPALSFMLETSGLFSNSKSFMVFNEVPFLYETDSLCSSDSNFLDYFLFYQIVFLFKFKLKTSRYYNESVLRLFFKLPLSLTLL